MQKPTLLLLAAGMGSRYGSLKQLDAIGPNGETMIDYAVFDAIRAGFNRVVFVIRQSFADEFKEKVSDKFKDKIEVRFAFQSLEISIPGVPPIPQREKPWGTGHAVLVAQDLISTPFAVANADDFYGANSYKAMADFLMQRVTSNRFSMIGFELGKTLSPNGTVSRGVCETDESGLLQSVLERKMIAKDADGIFDMEEEQRVDLKPKTSVSMNLWGFHPDFFRALSAHFTDFVKANSANLRAEFYIPLVVNELLQSREVTVEVIPSSAQWQGVTYQEDKMAVQNALKGMYAEGEYPLNLWPKNGIE